MAVLLISVKIEKQFNQRWILSEGDCVTLYYSYYVYFANCCSHVESIKESIKISRREREKRDKYGKRKALPLQSSSQAKKVILVFHTKRSTLVNGVGATNQAKLFHIINFARRINWVNLSLAKKINTKEGF